MSRNRELDLDIMRGIIIVMVVFCHSVNTDFTAASRWFQTSYFTLLLVMMPSFMFVSGIVYSLSGRRPDCLKAYLDLALNRMKRLLIPFILFATIIFLGKLVLQQFATLEKAVALQTFKQIILTPKASAFGSFLWFIYVLLEYYMVVSLIHWLLPSRWKEICLVLGVILQFIPGTDFLSIKQFNEFFLFFALGIIAHAHYENYLRLLDKSLIFLGAAVVITWGLLIAYDLPALPFSALSFLVLHGISRIPAMEKVSYFLLTGKFMYPIYFMNTIFINVFKMIYSSFIPLQGIDFTIYTILCVAVGTLGPVAAQRVVISRVPFLRTLIR